VPLTVPVLDSRRYQDLLDEALARIPVHTPEWTNFNKSDPGVTILSVVAFVVESLLYRANQIPERNRRKFLQLLGVPLAPGASARGLVAFSYDPGVPAAVTLNSGMEVRAGQTPFRTSRGLDVLPVTAQLFVKQTVQNPDEDVVEYYRQLYESFRGSPPTTTPVLYEAVQIDPQRNNAIDLSATIDGSLWIALLAKNGDVLELAREAIGGKTLSLGVVPVLTDAQRRLAAAGTAGATGREALQIEIPKPPPGGRLPEDEAQRVPQYRMLTSTATADVLLEPGVIDVGLPAASELSLWTNLDPLESGVGEFPPALEDTSLEARLITWLRIRPARGAQAVVYWAGINVSPVEQRARIAGEPLPPGTGEPDQAVTLAKSPVIPESVEIVVTAPNGTVEVWKRVEDLLAAGPEVPTADPRLPPGTLAAPPAPSKVFTVNAESGEVRFGDGMRGARPPAGALLRASYDYGEGIAGNVGPGAISTGAALPTGVKVTNPIPTWGGAQPETVAEGEKQIARYLQHRDRLVTAEDFETIALRTPGVEIGRVEVIPEYNPQLATSEPGDTPGAVTLMIVPGYDPAQPAAPRPNALFLDAICRYLNPRRLLTTEVFLRGPSYQDVWVSVGMKAMAGFSPAEVRENVKAAIQEFLAPLRPGGATLPEEPATFLTAAQIVGMRKGWPLRKPILRMELAAVAGRVPGVELVSQTLVARGSDDAGDEIEFRGLELPRLMGVSVTIGDAAPLDQLRGQAAVPQDGQDPRSRVAVPKIPEECRCGR
jgi:hypothetical protein